MQAKPAQPLAPAGERLEVTWLVSQKPAYVITSKQNRSVWQLYRVADTGTWQPLAAAADPAALEAQLGLPAKPAR